MLNQYAQQPSIYFTSGSTFIFLAGNHSLENEIHVIGLSNITLKSGGEMLDIRIFIKNESGMFFEDVLNLKIERLAFIFHSNKFQNSSTHSGEIAITNSSFQGSKILTDTFARAIDIVYSEITITNCLFKGSTGDNGGAIIATGSSALYLNGMCNIVCKT